MQLIDCSTAPGHSIHLLDIFARSCSYVPYLTVSPYQQLLVHVRKKTYLKQKKHFVVITFVCILFIYQILGKTSLVYKTWHLYKSKSYYIFSTWPFSGQTIFNDKFRFTVRGRSYKFNTESNFHPKNNPPSPILQHICFYETKIVTSPSSPEEERIRQTTTASQNNTLIINEYLSNMLVIRFTLSQYFNSRIYGGYFTSIWPIFKTLLQLWNLLWSHWCHGTKVFATLGSTKQTLSYPQLQLVVGIRFINVTHKINTR